MSVQLELEMATRHVREGASVISRQRRLIAFLEARGVSTDAAENLLAQFEDIQSEHVEDLDRITSHSQH